MKKIGLLMASLCLYYISQAQDTTIITEDTDTIRIGGMVIIKKKDGKNDEPTKSTYRHKHKPANISTSWCLLDFGFSNFTDNTNYGSLEAQGFAPGATADWFEIRNGKSVNVNFWLFMQRLNLIKHVVNLKYGLGLELNNYRYEQDIRFKENPTVVYMDTISYNKNKLAADYVTVPVMLNFNFTPNEDESYKSFGLSVGMSAGYLYSSRQKYVSAETGKDKTKDNFDLRPLKISYIAELQLGPVVLYGSLADRSMFENGLDQTPYNLGIRLGNWQ